MAIKIVLSTLLIAAFIASPAFAVKDEQFAAYLIGDNLKTLGISSLGGTAYTPAPVGSGFLTLTDLGKNAIAWEINFDKDLPNKFLLNLYYYNATNAANPPLLLILTDNFSDKTPFGNFTVNDVSNGLVKLGLPPLNTTAPSPLLPLIQGKNLVAGLVSTDNKAIVGQVSDDSNVGPPPADFSETFFLTDSTLNGVTFPGSSNLPNASVVFDIIDNQDGSLSYDLFLTLLTDAQNKTLQTPNTVKLIAIGKDGNPVPVYDFKFTPDQFTNALDSTGISGDFKKKDLINSIKAAAAGGKIDLTKPLELFLQSDISDATGPHLIYSKFDPTFDFPPEAFKPATPSPKPHHKSPKPSPKKPSPKKSPSPKKPSSPKKSPAPKGRKMLM